MGNSSDLNQVGITASVSPLPGMVILSWHDKLLVPAYSVVGLHIYLKYLCGASELQP